MISTDDEKEREMELPGKRCSLGIDHGRHTRFGAGHSQMVREEGKGKGVFLRFEAFEAFHADGVALGLYLRAAISVADLRVERHLGGASARGI
jgi:hypothetical protein